MNSTVLKKASDVALIGLGILLVAAVICYKERVFFADAAYILFTVINYKNLAIQCDRYGSFISQAIPYLGAKLHLPLKVIAVGYSAGFNLFYLFTGFTLVSICRQYALAILLTLYYFLVVSASYFWISNEVHQAIAWMFLLFGITIWLGGKKTNILLIVLAFSALSFLTIFTHFVAIIAAVFLFGYFIIEKEHWPFSRWQSILLFGIFVIVTGCKFIASQTSDLSYDSLHLHNLLHFSLKDIIASFTTPVVTVFLARCLTNYWLLIVILACGLFALIKQRKKWLAAWTIISVVGYFIVMGLVYGDLDGNTQLFHVESEWACLGILVSAPFVFSFLPGLQGKQPGWLLAGILFIRLLYIAAAYPQFGTRISLSDSILAEMRKKGITKLALYRDPKLKESYMIDWAAGFESLLRSAANGDKPNLTYIFIDSENNKQVLEAISVPGDTYLWDPLHTQNFNPWYYTVDSVHPYTVMSYSELMK